MSKKVLAAIVAAVVIAGGGWYAWTASRKAAAPSAATQEIVLGFNAALTKNAVANYGIGAKLGFQVAVDEINAAGGILGRQIRPIIMDDEGDKDISRKNVEQLIFQDHVNAIIGPANSGNMLNWMDLAEDNEIIAITPVATASELTTRYAQRPRNFIFRISSIDKELMRVQMSWVLKKTNNGKVAVLYDTTPYGIQGEKDFTEVLSRWGKTPVFDKQFDKAAPPATFVQLLKDAQKSGADAVMIYSLVDGAASFVKASTQIDGFKPMLLGTAATAIDLWDLAGPASTNMYFASVITDDTDPRVASLLEKSKALNGGTPTPALTTGANGYDAVYLLKAAFEKAGSTDKEAVFDALENTTDVQGVNHVYVKPFSKEDHEAFSAADVQLGHWVDGKRVLLDDETKGLEIR